MCPYSHIYHESYYFPYVISSYSPTTSVFKFGKCVANRQVMQFGAGCPIIKPRSLFCMCFVKKIVVWHLAGPGLGVPWPHMSFNCA